MNLFRHEGFFSSSILDRIQNKPTKTQIFMPKNDTTSSRTSLKQTREYLDPIQTMVHLDGPK